MSKYLVMFGFEVKAKNSESARLKAKRNLKPARQRKPIDYCIIKDLSSFIFKKSDY